MSIEQALIERSSGKCELCSAEQNLAVAEVSPSDGTVQQSIYLCDTCSSQIADADSMDMNHWRCLNESAWSQEPAVQAMAWRLLNRLSAEGWAQDLMDMLYLEDDVKQWAEAAVADENKEPHRDSNGAILKAGDSVVLIKDLDVKGTGFTAKRGTAVRNIGLSAETTHIEGRVNGTRIVIVTKYVKKM